jgi:hypothetical protein
MRILIGLFVLMRVRIQGAKSMRVPVRPKVTKIYTKNILKVGNRSKNIPVPTKVQTAGNQVYMLFLVNFHVSGSVSKIPIWIRIRTAISLRIHTDPDPQHWFSALFQMHLCIKRILS